MMEDIVFTPPNSSGGNFLDSPMDLDFMDELLFEGCWIETTDASNYSLRDEPSKESANNPACRNGTVLLDMADKEPCEKQTVTSSHASIEVVAEDESQNVKAVETVSSSGQNEVMPVEGSEVRRSWWIAPKAGSGPSSSVRQRLVMVVDYLKECMKNKDLLIQIWVPVRKGDQNVLTTYDQPFSLAPNSKSLESYRTVSTAYNFAAEQNSKEAAGLPGLVFLGKLPEWTPDVRFFRSEEYPRVSYAQRYNVGGSLALPVFERGSGTCLGVVEIVMTSQRINYRPELESVCKALEAVDLRSTPSFNQPSAKACNGSYLAALPRIKKVLTSVCNAYRLPLALTWASCILQGREGPRHSNENYTFCVSTVDSACFVADKRFLSFQEACSDHHLLKGQGIVGRAFTIAKPCSATDVTAFSKMEYPLAHHARMFDLRGATAVPLVNIHTGSVDFVLEFFMRNDYQNTGEQDRILKLLSSVVHQAFQKAQGKEFKEDVALPGKDTGSSSNERTEEPAADQLNSSFVKGSSPQKGSWIADMAEAQKISEGFVSLEYQKQAKGEFMVATNCDDTLLGLGYRHVNPQQDHQEAENAHGAGIGTTFGEIPLPGRGKSVQKRRTKAEKAISLEVLRQYFSGSLKDAAKSIGVCPTTLKRICRQHGISRWPSRKIKKVGHSLKKLQLVIDSVQGADGSIQIDSFYNSFPELNTSKPSSRKGAMSSLKHGKPLGQLKLNPCSENLFGSGATSATSPSSSCSRSTSSTTSSSTGPKQHCPAINMRSQGDTVVMLEENFKELKRHQSNEDLFVLSEEEPQLLTRSQNQASFDKNPESVRQVQRDTHAFRLKAVFGDEKIRFSLQPEWGFKDVQREVARRFGIQKDVEIALKYLDDDHEWVLLTCDADLEECMDVYRMSADHTIRISVHRRASRQGDPSGHSQQA